MELLENPLAAFSLDEEIKEMHSASEQAAKTEKQIQSRLNKIKKDQEDKELRKKIAREKRKQQKAARHEERVAFLSKMSVEERKEFIHKERAAEAELLVFIPFFASGKSGKNDRKNCKKRKKDENMNYFLIYHLPGV